MRVAGALRGLNFNFDKSDGEAEARVDGRSAASGRTPKWRARCVDLNFNFDKSDGKTEARGGRGAWT
jgi:hypothetical protein